RSYGFPDPDRQVRRRRRGKAGARRRMSGKADPWRVGYPPRSSRQIRQSYLSRLMDEAGARESDTTLEAIIRSLITADRCCPVEDIRFWGGSHIERFAP